MKLRASWADLHDYLETRAAPLAVLRAVNLFPGRSPWRLDLTADGTRLDANLVPPEQKWPRDPRLLLTGIIPELLSGTRVALDDGMRLLVANDLHDARREGNYSSTLACESFASAGEASLHLQDYMSSRLDPQWTHLQAVVAYLHEHTWFGSAKYRHIKHRVELNILGLRYSLSNSVPRGPEQAHDFTLQGDGVRLHVTLDSNLKGIGYRHADFGRLTDSLLDPITVAVARAGVTGAQIEIDAPQALSLGALGQLFPKAEFAQSVPSLARQMETAAPIKAHREQLSLERIRRQADRLNQRIEDAQSGSRLFVHDQFVGLEPKSEQATVALFCKLEGMRALPFYYLSKAWAGGEGIDAIADFRMTSTDVTFQNAPVEFEYSFKNFFTHRHPHNHVRLVICWRMGIRDQRLQPAFAPWVHTFSAGPLTFPVIEVSRFPNMSMEGS